MLTFNDSLRKQIRKFPLLSHEEEIDLARRLIVAREQGHEQERIWLRNKFMAHNIRLVLRVMGRFRHSSVAAEDLFSEGMISLMRAVDKFDPDRGCRFNTYAWAWIHQGMRNFIQSKGHDVHIPAHVLEDYAKVQRARSRLGAFDVDDIAREAKLSADKVLHAILSVNKEMSLSQPLIEDLFLEDVLGVEDSESGFDRIMHADNAKNIKKYMAVLNARERAIIEKRFGLNGHEVKTLHEIGQEQGVSRERIRQLERDAMQKLTRRAREN